MRDVLVWLCFVALGLPAVAAAQESAVLRVEVRSADAPIPGALIAAGVIRERTDEAGIAVLRVPAGAVMLEVTAGGFLPVERRVDARAGTAELVVIVLARQPDVDEEVTVVATTRTGRRVDDQPMRVEVLEREEIEEKMLMTPGDIVMMLNEMGGLRVQATSPSLGAAAVRIQGMRGRYTRFLSDGLPLFGEQPGGLGLLQIPPMDLGQVEVIKGVASALYGAGAMGGVVNLLSRRPGPEAQHELLLNQSTRGGTDAVLFLSGPAGAQSGFTLLASAHRQARADVDDDGWADMASYARAVVRPRFFRDDGAGRSFFATAGFTREEREGGTMPDLVPPAIGGQYREALETTRFDGGVSRQLILSGRYVTTWRAAAMTQAHHHRFGDVRERDRHTTAFGELAVRGSASRHTWVAGIAAEVDRYALEERPDVDYSYVVPGVFVQDDVDVASWLSVSASARVDRHSEFGTFVSPRVSALVRGGGWTSRWSYGEGFHDSSPLVEDTEAAGLTRLRIAGPLEAEEGRSLSVDVGHDAGSFSWLLTGFSSRIENALVVERDDEYVLRNLDGITTNRGVELLATFRRAPVAVTGSYTFVRSREREEGEVRDVALTPRHSAGVVAMVESEAWGRVGLEVYYTGRQRLEADPRRTTSEPYVIVGLLGERHIAGGRYSLFLNGENLTNVRQSHWDPLVRPARAVDGRWTVDAWAPLEGRVVNGGIRVRF
jgi:iron complex outermembrane receptor protein